MSSKGIILDFPSVVYTILIRCRHETIDGRKLSDRGTTRVRKIFKSPPYDWVNIVPILSDGSLDPSAAFEDSAIYEVECPTCGSTLDLRDREVQAVLDSYLDYKQIPTQRFIDYINKRVAKLKDPSTPEGFRYKMRQDERHKASGELPATDEQAGKDPWLGEDPWANTDPSWDDPPF